MSTNTTGLSEVVLVVSNVAAATRFYLEAVGLEPISQPGAGWAWFWTGPPGHSTRLAVTTGPLLFEERSPHPPAERFGRVHVAFHVPRDRLEIAIARLRQHGVSVYGPQRLEWMKATGHYFFDTDGNLLEYWSPDPM